VPGEQKTCVICGADVTDKPRIKDSKGRYACKACAEQKARAAKAKQQGGASKPAAAAAGGAGMMEQWLSESTEGKIALGAVEQPRCPKCEHPMMPDSVVCMGCGFNTQSGKKLHTRIQKADKDKSAGGGGASLGEGNTPIIIAFVAAIGLIAGAATLGEMGVVPAAVAGLWFLGAWIMMIVAAFQDGDNKWGIFALCGLVPCLGLPLALAFTLYYCTVGSTRAAWKANYWLAMLAYIGAYAAVMINNPEMFASDF